MGSCIICGTSVEGRICSLHEEDVVFEFRGDRPDQLTTNRYYRGVVDGYADFGVFIDIGERVTGLLHRSELDQRLESLDWDEGDVVYVQVQQVRDNGNVDLGWSIRQSEGEFRGTLVDDPDQGPPFVEADERDDEESEGNEHAAEERQVAAAPSGDEGRAGGASDDGADVTPETAASESPGGTTTEASDGGTTTEASDGGAATAAASGSSPQVVEEPTEATIGSLPDQVGEQVRIEGVVESVRQTSGPTIFEIRDETGAVECAAFEAAGIRAYPDIGTDDVVRLDGEVRERRGDIQVETEALVRLEDERRAAVEQRIEDAIEAEARPEAVEPLAEDATVSALADDLVEVATAIRRAVIEERPVVVRHRASADGYVAGVALERATLPLIREHHQKEDAVYHYFDRRPLEGGVYDMDDATKDVTTMLSARDRHGEKLPLFVFVAAGATRESLDGFGLLDIYGAGRALVDDVSVDPEVEDAVDALVAPEPGSVSATTATTLAANVAAHVNDAVRADLQHLPAVSFWEGTPAAYVETASAAGYDEDATREIREAVALEAFYQSYEDKRELITDLLFAEEADGRGLASHVSQQFREKLDAEVETAEANLDHQTVDDVRIAVLDTEAFTHRYEFPPVELLLDELHRRHRDEAAALVGVGEDKLHVRTDDPVDVRDVADRARADAPETGLAARSARDSTLEFLAGERSAVLDAVVAVLAEELR